MLRNRSSISIRIIFGLLLVSCLTLFAPPTRSLAASAIKISSARAMPLGTTVTIKGTVTVPSGLFASSSFDQGFAIQDKTGGIYVSIATNLGLQLRDQVEVTGQLADSFGLLILVPAGPADVKQKGNGPRVEPKETATNAIGEATEGRLVQIEGRITQSVSNDLPYGRLFFIDDGSGAVKIYVNASTNIDVSGLQLGQEVRITGFSGQFDTQYEVDVRVPGDIQAE